MTIHQHPTLDLDSLLQHASWLRRLARSLVLDDGEADDVVQETWLAAVRQRDAEQRHPRAWLAGTLRNVVLMRRRGEGRRRAHESELAARRPDPLEPSSDLSAQVVSRERALLDCVAALPETQRTAVIARYFEGLTPRAIARRDGVPLETVKSRLKRGLEALRRQLDEEHGDRRTWSLWLLPLANGHKSAAGVAALAVGAVAVTLLTALTAFGLSEHQEPPTAEEPPALVAVDSTPTAPATSDVAALDGSAVDQRSTLIPDVGTTEVLVLDAPGGAPVAGADVAVLEVAAIEDLIEAQVEYVNDIERLFLERGTWSTTDAKGRVSVNVTPPLVVHAGTDVGVAFHPLSEPAASVELILQPAVRVHVEVSDASGSPVDGIPVTGVLVLHRTDRDEGLGGPDRYSYERTTEDGEVWFQDPGGATAMADLGGARPTWAEFRLALPGVPETAPHGQKRTSILLNRKHASRQTIRLQLPKTAPLALEIIAGDDERSELDGTAYLRVLSGRDARSNRYLAEIVDGRATWPQVALGIAVEIEVRLPELGAKWTVTGSSSDRAEELTTIRTVRTQRPTWHGRLVDADGSPLAGVLLTAHHRERGEEYSSAGMNVRTDENGAFRFEWEDPNRVDTPIHLVAYHIREQGVVALDVEREAVHADHDLGDLELELAVQRPVVGRCVDSAGQPIADLRIQGTQVHGQFFGCETDANGRFSLRGIYGETCHLKIEDRKHRFATLLVDLPLPQQGTDQEFVMTRGATVAGHLQRPAYLEARQATMFMMRRRGSEDWTWVNVDPDGDFERGGLTPGTWDAELRLSSTAPLAEIKGLVLSNGETTRLEAPRLDTLIRPVEIVPVNMPPRTRIRARVFGPTGVLGQQTLTKKPLIVPLSGTWSVCFSAPGHRSVTIADATSLGETHDVHLPAPIRITLIVGSAPPPGHTLSLSGEPGSLAEGEHVSISLDGLLDGRVDIRMPAPGTYRLWRSETPRSAAPGSIVEVASSEPTTEVIEIPDGDGPHEIGILLGAPTRDQ